MKASTSLLLATCAAIAALGGITPARAGSADPVHRPLRPVSACLKVDRINEWYAPDEHTLAVRAGPDHFRIDLTANCPRLGLGGDARMVTSSTPGLHDRMCGDIGEKIVTIDGLPCAVKSVTPIDAKSFRSLEKTAIESRRRGKAKD